MESTLSKCCTHLDSITRFLTPLLPIANCHMVEFFTHNHWDNLVPTGLRKNLEALDLNDAVDKFWKASAQDTNSFDPDTPELSSWLCATKSHCLTPNSDFCLTREEFQTRVTEWGGTIRPEIQIKEFMNPKKSYEVAVLSRLVASLSSACGATCCVEAGGGRGALAASLSLAHKMRALSVDCAPNTVRTATQRTKAMQKAWHCLEVTTRGNIQPETLQAEKNVGSHKFASAFITGNTDLAAIVKQHYPELDDQKLILTGLHTCGNLGPDSLRIFVSQQPVVGLLNVPCCYHLITEPSDSELFDVFQKQYGTDHGTKTQGFPMSEYLRGYKLGRNARMLAAQSIDRVVAQRELPSRTLLYRALLQVLIKKHLPELSTPEGKLKRLSNCENFQQYFKAADAKLHLELFHKLSDSYLTEFCRDIESQWKKMVLFYFLRLCLAQVVESVILLDRLVFLVEQGVNKVFLVKLFDPVLSPRCHSIVAVR